MEQAINWKFCSRASNPEPRRPIFPSTNLPGFHFFDKNRTVHIILFFIENLTLENLEQILGGKSHLDLWSSLSFAALKMKHFSTRSSLALILFCLGRSFWVKIEFLRNLEEDKIRKSFKGQLLKRIVQIKFRPKLIFH